MSHSGGEPNAVFTKYMFSCSATTGIMSTQNQLGMIKMCTCFVESESNPAVGVWQGAAPAPCDRVLKDHPTQETGSSTLRR